MSDWNYEALGFRSQKEMEESIERVKEAEKNPQTDLQIRAKNKARSDVKFGDGEICFAALEEGARLAELDRAVANKLYWEKVAENRRAEQAQMGKLLKAVTEKVAAEKAAEADKESNLDKAYKGLLKDAIRPQ